MTELRYMRILLVEDHADSAAVLERLLELDGSDVEVAHDVNSALRAAAAGGFDLVISDIGLPDGDGCELMRLLKHKYKLDGIAITGFSNVDEREVESAGFRRLLRKPISGDQLTDALNEFFTAPRA